MDGQEAHHLILQRNDETVCIVKCTHAQQHGPCLHRPDRVEDS
jgi:hypothetical protein